MSIFSQGGQIFSQVNFLAKLLESVQYSTSNNVEGVAESWVETEMSWILVDGACWRLK